MAFMRSVAKLGLNSSSHDFEERMNLLHSYLDVQNIELQLHALNAIQQVDFEMEHPKGEWLRVVAFSFPQLADFCFLFSPTDLLRSVFGKLYDAEIVKKEAFNMWKDSEPHQQGKGVQIKALTSFFVYVNSDILTDEEDSPADDSSSFVPV